MEEGLRSGGPHYDSLGGNASKLGGTAEAHEQDETQTPHSRRSVAHNPDGVKVARRSLSERHALQELGIDGDHHRARRHQFRPSIATRVASGGAPGGSRTSMRASPAVTRSALVERTRISARPACDDAVAVASRPITPRDGSPHTNRRSVRMFISFRSVRVPELGAPRCSCPPEAERRSAPPRDSSGLRRRAAGTVARRLCPRHGAPCRRTPSRVPYRSSTESLGSPVFSRSARVTANGT